MKVEIMKNNNGGRRKRNKHQNGLIIQIKTQENVKSRKFIKSEQFKIIYYEYLAYKPKKRTKILNIIDILFGCTQFSYIYCIS